jgi:hypothetical protein
MFLTAFVVGVVITGTTTRVGTQLEGNSVVVACLNGPVDVTRAAKGNRSVKLDCTSGRMVIVHDEGTPARRTRPTFASIVVP